MMKRILLHPLTVNIITLIGVLMLSDLTSCNPVSMPGGVA